LHVFVILVVHLFVLDSLIVRKDILLADFQNVLGVYVCRWLVLLVFVLLPVLLRFRAGIYLLLFWLREALAETDLLVAAPTEVLGADVAVVGLRLVSVDGVGRVTGWASYALTLSQGQSLPLFVLLHILICCSNTHHAILTLALDAVGHPLDLVNKLEVVFANAADRLLVHVFDSLYIFLVLQLGEVEQREQDIARHDAATPLSRLAADHVHGNFLAIL
jgi:hypothetical protein